MKLPCFLIVLNNCCGNLFGCLECQSSWLLYYRSRHGYLAFGPSANQMVPIHNTVYIDRFLATSLLLWSATKCTTAAMQTLLWAVHVTVSQLTSFRHWWAWYHHFTRSIHFQRRRSWCILGSLWRSHLCSRWWRSGTVGRRIGRILFRSCLISTRWLTMGSISQNSIMAAMAHTNRIKQLLLGNGYENRCTTLTEHLTTLPIQTDGIHKYMTYI